MINILWNDRARMSFSCCASLNAMFDLYPTKHYALGDTRPDGGAVIIFHGGNQARPEVAEQLNKWAIGRPWVIFIGVGDENSDFEYARLKHSNKRVWIQTPKPGKVSGDRYLIEGPPSDCRPLLDAAGPIPRCFDWFFAGQVNHVRRENMITALRDYPYGPKAMVETKSFGAGLPHEMYYQMMKQAYVVPCPSGLATPDSFRFAESLEAGCIPVIDACAPDGVMGYWDMVLGSDHPFIVIEDWATFPEVARKILTNGGLKRNQEATQKWWLKYRHSFNQWLAEDIISLKGKI